MSGYFVIDSSHPDMMLLVPPADPSIRDSWLFGKPFQRPPKAPVAVTIRQGHEHGQRLDYFGTARLMSDALCEVVRDAGVDNLELYDAVLKAKDGSVQYTGYKAFNLIGMVSAAALAPAADPVKTEGLLMFRLAQYPPAVIVHARVREAIEAHGFPNLLFRATAELSI